jgi:phage anti-repressor protein
MNLIKTKEENLISARDIFIDLGIKRDFSNWIKYSLDKAMLEEGKDFTTILAKSTGGRPSIEYYLKRDAAISIAIVSGGKNAKKVRDEIIRIFQLAETGLLLSKEQIMFLLELIPVMGLFSIQDDVEKKHFVLHNNKYDWWQYRANVIGYGTDQLKMEVEKLNHKYRTQKQALMIVDKYELIRIGIIDLFIALGKSVEYASNIADICKDMAKGMKTTLWDDTPTKNSIPFDLRVNKSLANSIKENQLKLK